MVKEGMKQVGAEEQEAKQKAGFTTEINPLKNEGVKWFELGGTEHLVGAVTNIFRSEETSRRKSMNEDIAKKMLYAAGVKGANEDMVDALTDFFNSKGKATADDLKQLTDSGLSAENITDILSLFRNSTIHVIGIVPTDEEDTYWQQTDRGNKLNRDAVTTYQVRLVDDLSRLYNLVRSYSMEASFPEKSEDYKKNVNANMENGLNETAPKTLQKEFDRKWKYIQDRYMDANHIVPPGKKDLGALTVFTDQSEAHSSAFFEIIIEH